MSVVPASSAGAAAADATLSGQPAHDVATPATDALRLQILATEHWSLLASRALAWNESFSRAGMFLSTLSGATVALALAAQASNFGRTFVLFALAVLPVVLYVGVTTFARLGHSNYHDFRCVVGMNRIRSAYLEIEPELKPYFVMSQYDDVNGVVMTQGYPPERSLAVRLVSATPAVVATLTSAVAGVIGALLGYQVSHGTGALVGGLVGFAVVMVMLNLYARRQMLATWGAHHPQFPSPDTEQQGHPRSHTRL